MTNYAFFQNKLTGKEQLWGWRYLLFQAVFLPGLLSMLPLPLSAAGLNLLFFSINLFAVLLIFHRYLRQIFPIPGKRLFCILGISIVFFALYQGCSFAIGYLLSSAFGDFANVNDQSISAMAAEDFPLMFLSTVLLAPVTEECFYRGLVFRGLYDRAPWAAWIVSVILFGLIHIINYIGSYPPITLLLCFFQYIPAGLCLAAAYRISGSLLCPILIHAAVNAIGMLSLR